MPQAEAVAEQATESSRATGQANSRLSRFNATPKIAELQMIAYRMAKSPRSKPHIKIAAMGRFVDLEERRRLNLGRADPATVKTEPKRQRKPSSGPASEPTPKPTTDPS